MIRAVATSLLALFVLSGCATPVVNYVAPVERFSRPPLNAVATAAVGDEMLSVGNIVTQEGIELQSSVAISGYTLSPGFYPKTGQSDQGAFHSFFFQAPSQSGYGAMTANFLMDPPQSVMTTSTPNQICVVTVFNVRTCDTEQFRHTSRAIESDNAFQQTLIYSGRVDNRIRISYREFSGSLARAAFSNEVEYDLATSDTIAYRGARLRIVSADNTQITYEVLANFTPTTR